MSADHARCEAEIQRLTADVERITRLGHENATRYASDLAAAERAGAARVERIRSAILDGAADSAQRAALQHATWLMTEADAGFTSRATESMAGALIACNEALREARAEVARMREAARTMVAP